MIEFEEEEEKTTVLFPSIAPGTANKDGGVLKMPLRKAPPDPWYESNPPNLKMAVWAAAEKNGTHHLTSWPLPNMILSPGIHWDLYWYPILDFF